MAFTKDKSVKRLYIDMVDDTIEIHWSVKILEDGVEVADRMVAKVYTQANSTDLDTDVSAGMATKLKNIFNW